MQDKNEDTYTFSWRVQTLHLAPKNAALTLQYSQLR